MTDHARALIDLLNGDFVRLETPELSVETEVIGHERERRETASGREEWCYTIEFMPVGEDATRVSADRYRVEVEGEAGEWTVGDLVAEVYVEEELDYDPEPRGPLVGVEVLGRP